MVTYFALYNKYITTIYISIIFHSLMTFCNKFNVITNKRYKMT